MRKIFLIGMKDLRLAFRDRAALLLMLAAPFALTLGLGFVTGAFSSSSGISQVEVAIVNQDNGELGQALIDLFESPELAGLVVPSRLEDPAAARQLVDEDQVAGAVIVPPSYTASILSGSSSETPVSLELYTNPSRPTGSGVIETILTSFTDRVETGRVAGQVAATQLVAAGLIQPSDAVEIGQQIGHQLAEGESQFTIPLDVRASGDEPAEFNILAIFAPGMALMFLMFTTTNGGRALLSERNEGTLPRLLITPTSSAQVLGGKVVGIYLTGVAQVAILIVATALLFGVRWGSWLGVTALILAAVAGAVGWGLLITALAKSPGQVNGIGSAIMLIFGILGGTFTNLETMPAWFSAISKVTPNAWGVQGFITLASGGGLDGITGPLAALLAMGAVLFLLSLLLIRRRGLALT